MVVEAFVPIAQVQVSGIPTATVGSSVVFTATVAPSDATLPITYTWTATDQAPQTQVLDNPTAVLSYTWDTAGTKQVQVQATNAAGSVVSTDTTITISAPTTPIAVAQIALDGADSGVLSSSYSFTATVSPITARVPITFTWQADGQATFTTTLAAQQSSMRYMWLVTGTQRITVTAFNGIGAPVSASRTIAIRSGAAGSTTIYLPFVVGSAATVISPTPTITGTVTLTSTPTITGTLEPTPTSTETTTATLTPTITSTGTLEPTPTSTETTTTTLTPTITSTGTLEPTPTSTETTTATPTLTPTTTPTASVTIGELHTQNRPSLREVSIYRTMAGVLATITVTDAYHRKAQQAALPWRGGSPTAAWP